MSSTELVIDSKDIEFVLNECLNVAELKRFPNYQDYDQETINLLIEEGHKFAVEVIYPTRSEADQEGCKFENGRAIVPECLHGAYQQSYELGWPSLTINPQFGGQGAPHLLGLAVAEGMSGGNVGLTMYFALTSGCAGLIESFGTEEMKEKYLTKMYQGEFTGTMCLSEPHAGSDVGAGLTSAEPTGDGRYKIKGTKVWISSGDNNLGKNVIHAVLARLKGADSGTKGLSLFVVPAFHVNDDGSVGENNDVTVASIEHKMGIKCSATAVLNLGDNDQCYGYLLGEENKGITLMFQMMNEARLGVSTTALALSSAAYQNALAYAKERLQGPHISKMKDASAPRVPIIQHPDVRYNLMGMKARVEAQRALLYGATKYADIVSASEDKEEQQAANDMLDILTPMCKGWICEVGLDVVQTGIQILGGVGYTKDFPLEQMYRDLRITTIYEGTTGIQAMDLVGRKMTMRNSELFLNLIGRFSQLVETHKEHPIIGEMVQQFGNSSGNIGMTAMELQGMAGERGMEGGALYATPFLMNLAAVTAGYFLLEQSLVAADKLETLKKENNVDESNYDEFLKENSNALFYDNKLKTVQFYLAVVVPTFEALTRPIKNRNYEALDISF